MKINILTFLNFSLDLFIVTKFPALENICSDGTDVARMLKYFSTTLRNSGLFSRLNQYSSSPDHNCLPPNNVLL